MKKKATAIKGVYDIDGQPIEYQQRRRESMWFKCIFNWMQCDFTKKKKGINDIANHSMEYHQGRREAIGIQFIFNQMQ